MVSHSMVFVILAAFAACSQAGLIGHQAFVAPYASSYNAHHINHAVAHPLVAPAPVPVPVHHQTVLAAPAPAPAVVAAPAPVAFSAPAFLAGPHFHAAPHFLPAPAPLAFHAGLPAAYNLWK